MKCVFAYSTLLQKLSDLSMMVQGNWARCASYYKNSTRNCGNCPRNNSACFPKALEPFPSAARMEKPKMPKPSAAIPKRQNGAALGLSGSARGNDLMLQVGR